MGKIEEAVLEIIEQLYEDHIEDFHSGLDSDFDYYTSEEIDKKFKTIEEKINIKNDEVKYKRYSGFKLYWTEAEELSLLFSLGEALKEIAREYDRKLLSIIEKIEQRGLLRKVL